MNLIRVCEEHFDELRRLQLLYKREIGEDEPSDDDFERLRQAIWNEEIVFYACEDGGRLVGCCSAAPVFSTFSYRRGGVFEDFYIEPAYRHRGLGRELVAFAFRESGLAFLTVGAAACDVAMYKALGFTAELGTMLALAD